MVNKCANNIIKHMIPHTPSQVGVLQSITFFHIPDEARLVLLAKLCVPSKHLLCYREISLNNMLHRVRNLHKCMFSFIMVSNKCNKYYICKLQFADTEKCYDHPEILSSPYNLMLDSVCINFG